MLKYTIVDCMTGQRLMTIEAKSERSAIRYFRKGYALQHNYPNVVAVKYDSLTW